jgi:hypothetical protein
VAQSLSIHKTSPKRENLPHASMQMEEFLHKSFVGKPGERSHLFYGHNRKD